jgi:hypothetical protein
MIAMTSHWFTTMPARMTVLDSPAVMVKLIAMDVKRKGKELGHNKVNLLSLLKTCFNLRYNQSHLVLI